jgi:plasmid maintenance system antidote protein VapI
MNPPLGFRELSARLIRYLNAMVRRGEISERGLARLTQYSQPHIHNVLNGKRAMTIELADQIMALLKVPLVL